MIQVDRWTWVEQCVGLIESADLVERVCRQLKQDQDDGHIGALNSVVLHDLAALTLHLARMKELLAAVTHCQDDSLHRRTDEGTLQ